MTTTELPRQGMHEQHPRPHLLRNSPRPETQRLHPRASTQPLRRSGTIRPLLLELKSKHTMADLGRMLRCSPRTLTSGQCSRTRDDQRTLADNIRFASGEHFEPVEPIYRDKTGISGPETAEYAKTPEG